MHVLYYIICTVFVFLKLKESERTMDTLNTKRETQIVKSSVVDIPWANSFQQTLIVALLRFYKHWKKTVSVLQDLTAIYFVIVCAYFTLPLSIKS